MLLCLIAPDGTFEAGPHGWTAEKISDGVYDITHNLGFTAYAPLAEIVGVGADFRMQAIIHSRDETKVRIQTYDSTRLLDARFALIVFTL